MIVFFCPLLVFALCYKKSGVLASTVTENRSYEGPSESRSIADLYFQNMNNPYSNLHVKVQMT